jgi:hypothetical protein
MDTGQPIGEIAYDSGFSDYTHFARIFRRRFGHSPGAHAAKPLRSTGASVRLKGRPRLTTLLLQRRPSILCGPVTVGEFSPISAGISGFLRPGPLQDRGRIELRHQRRFVAAGCVLTCRFRERRGRRQAFALFSLFGQLTPLLGCSLRAVDVPAWRLAAWCAAGQLGLGVTGSVPRASRRQRHLSPMTPPPATRAPLLRGLRAGEEGLCQYQPQWILLYWTFVRHSRLASPYLRHCLPAPTR